MSWSIGYDDRHKRDIGYGVPAWCDHPKCNEKIDRGLSFVCGGEQQYGGENGCGLYFCSRHMHYHSFRGGDSGFFCKRCCTYKTMYDYKPEHPKWIHHKLTDETWKDWRKNNPKEVEELKSHI